MDYQIRDVTFEIDAQTWRDGQFSIPAEVCNVLRLNPGDEVILDIESALGRRTITVTLKSGAEIYGKIDDIVKARRRIRVTVRRSG